MGSQESTSKAWIFEAQVDAERPSSYRVNVEMSGV